MEGTFRHYNRAGLPVEYCELDGCCVGAVTLTGEPTMKSYVLTANFSLAGMHGLRCREGRQVIVPPPSGVGAVAVDELREEA